MEEFRADETGVYRCRVDFRTAQTRNTFFNVSLIGEARFMTHRILCPLYLNQDVFAIICFGGYSFASVIG